jgi:hypothetical protein
MNISMLQLKFKKRTRCRVLNGASCLAGPLKSEKGIALVLVMTLAVVALVIMAGLIYMITSSTQISGMQKKYRTALEAAVGGTDVTYQFIAVSGDTGATSSLLSNLSSISPIITTPATCTGTNMAGQTFTGLAAKVNTPSTSWSTACNKDAMSITPGNTGTYDITVDLGTSPYPTYRVYSKIVDTVEGNSTRGEAGLAGKGVVNSGFDETAVVGRPYLYTIEIDSENPTTPAERSKLSVLYQY